jgi:hypothetical protein
MNVFPSPLLTLAAVHQARRDRKGKREERVCDHSWVIRWANMAAADVLRWQKPVKAASRIGAMGYY